MMLVLDDFVEGRPHRLLDWREDEKGLCVLLRPKLGSGRLGYWLSTRLVNPYYHIKLDEIGTLVWKACNGRNSIVQISEQVTQRFCEENESIEPRLFKFIQQMVKARLIGLDSCKESQSANRRNPVTTGAQDTD